MARKLTNSTAGRRCTVTGNAPALLLALLSLPAWPSVVIQGTGASDTIDVSSATESHEIYGKGGSDSIKGSQAADLLIGDSGNDTISGNGGADSILGGRGNDVLQGGDGNDDFLYQATLNGYDVVDGGPGTDRVIGSVGDDTIGVRSLASIEVIDGGSGYDVLQMQSTGGLVLNLSGTTIQRIELIAGGSSSDTIIGSAGDDFLQGGNGQDRIDGGPGRDTALYSSESADYRISVSGSTTTIVALATRESTDTLTSVEVLTFADGSYENGVFEPRYPGNRPPIAIADSATVVEDQPVEVEVMANDSDPDGDSLSVYSYGQGAHGHVRLSGPGRLVYEPYPNFNGKDSFSYTIDDGRFGRTATQVSVTIVPVPDAPTARDDSVTLLAGSAAQVMPLLNDQDVDGDSISISFFSQPTNGTVSAIGSGQLQYAPKSGFIGPDEFQYSITDGTGRFASASVVIDVRPRSGDSFSGAISAAPEGSWLKVNQNRFSDVWTPAAQRPTALGFTNPAKIIHAWGSMAWDSNRRQLIFWGGGHANYSGNEVYRFDTHSGLWERASLPSQVVAPLGDKQYFAVDGAFNAPIAAHTYDNQDFLPLSDRFITFGGGKFNCCAKFVLEDGKTATGPYLWDPSRAGSDMVGGTTGSQVGPNLFPDVIGARSWQNRDSVVSNGSGLVRPTNFVSGTSAYAQHGDRDSILVTETPYDGGKLFRYTINDISDPALDEWQLVGVRGKSSYANQGAGAYDPTREIYARTANSSAGPVLVAWSLLDPGPGNTSINVPLHDSTGTFALSVGHGMDFDAVRRAFVLWDGGPDVWYVTPPDAFGTVGWTVSRATTNGGKLAPDRNSGSYTSPSGKVTPSRGILGKWKYARAYDVFLGVEDPVNGDVWVYKPANWQPVVQP